MGNERYSRHCRNRGTSQCNATLLTKKKILILNMKMDPKNVFYFQSIRYALHSHFLPLIKIHELYILDINETIAEFLSLARNQMPHEESDGEKETIKIIQDPEFRRLKASIDKTLALQLYNTYR